MNVHERTYERAYVHERAYERAYVHERTYERTNVREHGIQPLEFLEYLFVFVKKVSSKQLQTKKIKYPNLEKIR